jgi:hypothetical protein
VSPINSMISDFGPAVLLPPVTERPNAREQNPGKSAIEHAVQLSGIDWDSVEESAEVASCLIVTSVNE